MCCCLILRTRALGPECYLPLMFNDFWGLCCNSDETNVQLVIII